MVLEPLMSVQTFAVEKPKSVPEVRQLSTPKALQQSLVGTPVHHRRTLRQYRCTWRTRGGGAI